MAGRTVHECRERGIPNNSITKAQAGKFLAAVVRNSLTDDLGAIPVRLGVASGVVVGEIITYQHETSCLIETGCAVLQASDKYAATQNGQGVVGAADGQVAANANGRGTITGGGTRQVDGASVDVVYVRNLI